MSDEMIELLPCPFCGGNVRIGVFDNEGNPRPEEYENDPWSGLAFSPLHYERDAIGPCVIATHDGEPLGMFLYDTQGELVEAWNRRHPDAAPGEAVLGRELIAWAAEPANVYACEAYTVKFCVFCESLTTHSDDCLHLRARALRDSDAR